MSPLEALGIRLSTWFFQVFLAIIGALRPLGRYFRTHPRAERWADRLVRPPEELFKKVAYNCQMCGQCILHATGMTCPMNCPKNLRNGPCGGVRPDGRCEVKPGMMCVWVLAYERSQGLPWAAHMHDVNPPVDRRLTGTSSWINLLTERDIQTQPAWGVEDSGHG
jgi:hypothetical protein